MDLYIDAPPEARDFALLIQGVVESLEPQEALRVCESVHFVCMDKANGTVIPNTGRTVIVFVVYNSQPWVEVIAHEIGHFLCNHHIRGLHLGGSLPATSNPEFEKEANQKAQDIIRIFTKRGY